MNRKSKRKKIPAAMKRLNRLNRLISILRMLDCGEPLNSDIYEGRYGVDVRTLYRDIDDLRAAGFDIINVKSENGKGVYRFTPYSSLSALNLSENELMALLFGKQLAHRLGKPIEDAFNSLLKKTHEETCRDTRQRADRLQKQKQKLLVAIDPVNDFEKIERQYQIISMAMDENQKLKISYHGMKSQRETKREVAPYGLFYSSGIWYMVGKCYKENDIRTFALDRIKDIKLTGKNYCMSDDFNIESYLQKGWRIINYGKPVNVELKFSKEVARWVKRKKWHPMQKIEEQTDGSLILRVTLRGPEEIKRWSYNWAPHCEILSPQSLRNEAAEEIKRLAGVYGKG